MALNILCATDNNYVPYCGIMLTSVFENNKGSRIDVYIMIDKPLSEGNINRFKKLEDKYAQRINYIFIDKSFLERFPIKGMNYWSIATYYRLYAEDLLPDGVDKVLYLDCDIIVNSSLKPLFDIDLNNKAAGVVPDIYSYSIHNQERLHYNAQNGYFNAGVMLMNIEYWRKNKIGRQCFEFLGSHYDWIEANDQDVLNGVLNDCILRLPLEYNFQIQFLRKNFYSNLKNLQTEINCAKCNPIIIHYAAPIKPWMITYYKMPYLREWRHYKFMSLWRWKLPVLPSKKPFNYFIKRYFLWPFGLLFNQEYMSSLN